MHTQGARFNIMNEIKTIKGGGCKCIATWRLRTVAPFVLS